MFTLFTHIVLTSIVPIFLLISCGFAMDRKFHLDLYTLSKLNFYVFLPAYIFLALYNAKFDHSSLEVAFCGITVLFLGSVSATIVSKFTDFSREKVEIFRNSIMFNNCGNIGVAIITFIYSNDPFLVKGSHPYLQEATVAVVSLLVIQNISTNTLGFYQAGVGKNTIRDSVKMVLHMPTIYVVPSALLLKLLSFDISVIPIWPSIQFFGSAFVAVSMITLGAQINRTPLNFFKKDIMLASFMRLIVGPLLAMTSVFIFSKFYSPLPTVAAQTIIITYSVPTAINTALIALEMKNNPEYATQIVMASTFISAITMPIFILGAYYLFPNM